MFVIIGGGGGTALNEYPVVAYHIVKVEPVDYDVGAVNYDAMDVAVAAGPHIDATGTC